MNKRLLAIAERRLILLKKIESQRFELSEKFMTWQKPLTFFDTGLAAFRFIQNHPAILSGSMAVFMMWRRKGFAGLAQEGLFWLSNYPSAISTGIKYLSGALRSSGSKD